MKSKLSYSRPFAFIRGHWVFSYDPAGNLLSGGETAEATEGTPQRL